MPPSDESFASWRPRLLELCDEIGSATRALLLNALERGNLTAISRGVAEGAGDVTFGLDLPSEELLTGWLVDRARTGPISVLTEDSGWRHMGPNPSGAPDAEPVTLSGFDHGGPRIAFDPVDGTRNLMTNLRSAWTVVSFAPPGSCMPRCSDLTGGIVAELPTSRARTRTILVSERGKPCHLEERDLLTSVVTAERELVVDTDNRVDHGYFPFFRYMHDLRPAIAQMEADFLARLESIESADVRNCYDDQYICSAGQLIMLAMGTYRFVVDPRALLAERRGRPTITTKPYDIGGAVLCAQSAGCIITAPDGSALDFDIDTHSPISFVGYANAPTRLRLEPHWLAVSR